MIATDPKVEVWAIPAQDRRLPRLLRPHERLGARRGPARPRLYLLAQGRRKARRRRPESPRTSARSAPRRSAPSSGSTTAMRPSSSPAIPKKFVPLSPARRARAPARNSTSSTATGSSSAGSSTFPFYEWSEEEKRIDFAHNPFSMPQGGLEALDDAGPADDQGVPVRHGLQRLRDRLGRHPQPSARDHGQGLRDRRPIRGDGGGEVRRPLPRVPVRRAAAWRHGCRHRPHRHAAGRRQEPARDHDVPDEPAGTGSPDERAVGGHAAAAARAFPARGGAEEGRPDGVPHRLKRPGIAAGPFVRFQPTGSPSP